MVKVTGNDFHYKQWKDAKYDVSILGPLILLMIQK